MLTVACVNLKNYQGRGVEYVTKLRNMVARHLAEPHRFVCFTDDRSGLPGDIESLEMPCDLPTWWSKIGLLRPGLFDGDVLYFDLDVIITASIDHIVALARTDRSRLWMRDDFSYSLRNPKKGLGPEDLVMLGGPGTCNSSVMAWHGDAASAAWNAFTPEVMKRQHGDQNHVTRVLWPDRIGLLPDGSVQSYKYGIRMRAEKPAPIVVFHGNPKVTELSRSDPLRLAWV